MKKNHLVAFVACFLLATPLVAQGASPFDVARYPILKRVEEKERQFGGSSIGGGGGTVTAMPYIITTDPTVTTSSATTTKFFGSVGPQVNNGYDLGFPNGSWRNLYVSGTSYLGTLVVGAGGCTGCGGGGMSSSSHLIPSANNTFDIGAPTSSWRNLYVSTTAYIKSIAAGSDASVSATKAFDFSDTQTSFPGSYSLLQTVLTADPSANVSSPNFINSAYNALVVPASSTRNIYSLYANNGIVVFNGQGTASQVAGFNSEAYNNSTGTVTFLGGTTAVSFNTGAGVTTENVGIYLGTGATAGTIGRNIGAQIATPSTGGTIGLNIGLEIKNQNSIGATNYAIYSQGGNVALLNGSTITHNLFASTTNTYNLGSPTSSWRDLYVSSTIYGGGKIAIGSTASLNDGTHSRLFDFSETITDFSANNSWETHAVQSTLSPNASMAGKSIYSNVFDTNIGAGNPQTFPYIEGQSSYVTHRGGGTLTFVIGHGNILNNSASGTIATGESLVGNTTNSSGGNFGIARSVVARSSVSSGTMALYEGIRVFSPTISGGGAVGTTYGLRIGDMTAATNTSYAIYTEGGQSVFDGTVITQSLRPTTTNSYDFGTLGNAWRNIFASTSVRVSLGSASTTISSGNVLATGQYFAGDGAFNAPSYTFLNDSDTGIYNGSIDTLLIATGGSAKVSVGGDFGPITLTPGTDFELASGNFIPTTNNARDIGVFGTAFRDIYASGTIRTSSTLVEDGTVGAPVYSFLNDTNTGLYRVGSEEIGIASQGTSVATFQTNGGGGAIWKYGAGDFRFRNTDGVEFIDFSGVGATWRWSSNIGSMTFNQNFRTDTNNSYDFGAFGAAFKDMYSSGTHFLTGSLKTESPVFESWTYSGATSSTINKPCGVVYIGAAGQTATVNNSFATGDYFVMISPQGDPGVAQPPYVSTSSNQFTINTVSVITNATPYAWCVMKGM